MTSSSELIEVQVNFKSVGYKDKDELYKTLKPFKDNEVTLTECYKKLELLFKEELKGYGIESGFLTDKIDNRYGWKLTLEDYITSNEEVEAKRAKLAKLLVLTTKMFKDCEKKTEQQVPADDFLVKVNIEATKCMRRQKLNTWLKNCPGKSVADCMKLLTKNFGGILEAKSITSVYFVVSALFKRDLRGYMETQDKRGQENPLDGFFTIQLQTNPIEEEMAKLIEVQLQDIQSLGYMEKQQLYTPLKQCKDKEKAECFKILESLFEKELKGYRIEHGFLDDNSLGNYAKGTIDEDKAKILDLWLKTFKDCEDKLGPEVPADEILVKVGIEATKCMWRKPLSTKLKRCEDTSEGECKNLLRVFFYDIPGPDSMMGKSITSALFVGSTHLIDLGDFMETQDKRGWKNPLDGFFAIQLQVEDRVAKKEDTSFFGKLFRRTPSDRRMDGDKKREGDKGEL